MKVAVSLREAHPVGGLGTGGDYLAHTVLHRRLHYSVGADRVLEGRRIVGRDPHAGDCGEMDDRVRRCGRGTVLELAHVEVRGQGVDHLTLVGDVGDERLDVRVVERLEIDIQDFVALLEQMGTA